MCFPHFSSIEGYANLEVRSDIRFCFYYIVVSYKIVLKQLLYIIYTGFIGLLHTKLYIFEVLEVKIGPNILVRVYRSYQGTVL